VADALTNLQALMRMVQIELQRMAQADVAGAAVVILVGAPCAVHDIGDLLKPGETKTEMGRAILFASPFDTENLLRFLEDAREGVGEAKQLGFREGFSVAVDRDQKKHN
jgi:hypothetical protein